MPLTFEWNENKAVYNEERHGVSFAEVTTIFEDPDAIIISETKKERLQSENLKKVECLLQYI